MEPLRIAVVNNMSDAALRMTERQICALLQPASAGMLVDLRFYVLPGATRAKAVSDHIHECYDSLKVLEDTPPDGLIVTGAEPSKARFEDEWFWPEMAQLIEWVDENRVPAIWSCLAAHAAVYYRDGIERIPLRTKLSGIFECSIDTAEHQLLHGLARKWRVPHSRCNGLSRKQLDRHGYDVLSWSREVAVDMFVKRDRSLQLHLQGHPEYDTGTLIAEYHRNLQRVQHSGVPATVLPPVGICKKPERLGLQGRFRGAKFGFVGAAAGMHSDAGPAAVQAQDPWSSSACRLFSNWLIYLDAARYAKRNRPSWDARIESGRHP